MTDWNRMDKHGMNRLSRQEIAGKAGILSTDTAEIAKSGIVRIKRLESYKLTELEF